jgi:hypothetical protein
MRTLLLTIAVMVASTSVHADGPLLKLLDKADDQYFDALLKARAEYRESLSKALEHAEEIELFLLDFETEEVEDAADIADWDTDLPKGQFPIIPYGASAKVLQRRKLTTAERDSLLPSLRITIAGTGPDRKSSALCHFPVHGIRVWSDDKVAFQTSVCYFCRNFYIKYPWSDADWMVLTDPAFKKTMERLMPIPQEELDRFDAKRKRKSRS